MKTYGRIFVLVTFLLTIGILSTQRSTTAVAEGGKMIVQADNALKTYMSGATLLGSGATFPQPLYSQWGEMFAQEFGMKLNYQGVGSGQGVSNFKSKLVDFGATDDPVKGDDLVKLNALQFPMAVGGVVLIYNLDGVPSNALKLSPALLADIFMAKVTKWNDPAISAINPDIKLPDLDITTVHRADGSGTTAIFTGYLALISAEWKEKLGAGKTVNWIGGVGQKGNPGIAAYVQQTKGAIGYVEYAYATENKLSTTILGNAAGKFVVPSAKAFAAACVSADWTSAPGFGISLNNQAGDETWPIVGATYLLVYREQTDANKAKSMFFFFDWALNFGAEKAHALHYVAIPAPVVALIEKTWVAEMKLNGMPLFAPTPTAKFVVADDVRKHMANITLLGSGATFPQPLYSQWGEMFAKDFGMKLNYQGVGSGQGVSNFKSKLVDFGATDDPVKGADLEAMGAVQFPLAIGGIVLIYNLPGVPSGSMKLTPEALSAIFMGKITKWNDTTLVALNPDLKLPDTDITSVHRADGSGTTSIFTNYLAAISPEWKEKLGAGKTVNWIGGVGQKGNPGIAAYVQQTQGAIGYVEYAYATENKLSYTQLKNASGNFVMPTSKSFAAACVSADWTSAPGFGISLVNQSGAESWPIVGATYILVYREQADLMKAKAMLTFFDWCLAMGNEKAEQLFYVPIPSKVADMIRTTWRDQIKSNGSSVWQ